MIYFVYILYSDSADKYYIGSSDHPERRLKFHNTLEKGFTARYRPWKLVWTKEFPTKEDARRAEKKIKAWKSKVMIKRLILGLTEI